MGFDEIYETQKGVISRIDSYVNEIEPYLKSLSSIVSEINSNWTSDAGEKYYVITAIQKVRKNLGNGAKNLRTFTATSRAYLGQMHEFKKYNGACIYGICTVTNIKASKSNKTKIIIDTTKIKNLSTKINSIATKIETTASSLNTQISRVDGDLAVAIVGGRNTLQGYKNSINSQAQKLRTIAVAIKQIASNYEKTEKDLQKTITGIEQATIDAGLIATQTAADIVTNMLNATGIVGGTGNNVSENFFDYLGKKADKIKNKIKKRVTGAVKTVKEFYEKRPILKYGIEFLGDVASVGGEILSIPGNFIKHGGQGFIISGYKIINGVFETGQDGVAVVGAGIGELGYKIGLFNKAQRDSLVNGAHEYGDRGGLTDELENSGEYGKKVAKVTKVLDTGADTIDLFDSGEEVVNNILENKGDGKKIVKNLIFDSNDSSYMKTDAGTLLNKKNGKIVYLSENQQKISKVLSNSKYVTKPVTGAMEGDVILSTLKLTPIGGAGGDLVDVYGDYKDIYTSQSNSSD